jgi:D-3-phosphoglycerate dehydrogenase
MSEPVDALVIDLLEWIGPRARPYREVMDAWRTSCPRLPVWEEANARGYIKREHSEAEGALVGLTPLGLQTLRRLRQVTATT